MPNFYPTYLYIKRHSKTGLKYFGKTTKDVLQYKGSGKYWKRHISEHGIEQVVTDWFQLFEDLESLVKYAVEFSIKNDIVNSEEWANLKIETGRDRNFNTPGTIFNMSKAKKGKPGKPHSTETKAKMSATRKGRRHSEDTIRKMSESNKGVKRSVETRQKVSEGNKRRVVTEEMRKAYSDGQKRRQARIRGEL